MLLLGFTAVLLVMSAVLVCILAVRMRTIIQFGGAPYVASTRVSVQTAFVLAALGPNDRFADLGCGDGHVVLAAVKHGAKEAVGYEIDPLLASEASKKIASFKNAKIIKTDFWKADLSIFDVVYLFQIPYAMPRLEQKLLAELKPGSRVVSNGFRFPSWTPVKQEGTITLYTR